MKILLLADTEDAGLWDYFSKEKVKGVDMVLSAGDLKPDYLSFLVTMINRPVFYVPGNHDTCYDKKPPEGCDCIDSKIVSYRGTKIMGLGGSIKYNGIPPYQYTERQMKTRIFKMGFQLSKNKGMDILLTHAPLRGYGDAEDPAHRGFEAFLPLIEKYEPKLLIHGHVHQSYSSSFERIRKYKNTTIINASGHLIIDTEEYGF